MTGPDKAVIKSRHAELGRQRSLLRTQALRAVSEQTRPLFDELRAECGKTGHKWKFIYWNFDRSCAWDQCVWCGASEPADQHSEDDRVRAGRQAS